MTDWLQIAKDSWDSSSSYWDNNFRSKWENALRHFQSKHQSGSKYYTDAFKYRSKGFRPKTRSAVRGNEAAVMQAFFSNSDVVEIRPVNPEDPAQIVSADIHKELLTIRFTNHIKWFKLCIGAAQDAMVIGVVCSVQEWDKEKDCPRIDLIPVECVRFSPNADWLDPVNSSPYFIIMRPMYVMDVKEKIESGEWEEVSDEELSRAVDYKYDTTASVRDEENEDKYAISSPDFKNAKAFDVVWVHQNFVRVGGDDRVYFTLNTDKMLSDPVPIQEMYFHGERPVVIGEAVIEAHRPIPSSYVHIGSPLQTASNEIANQRSDNVQLVLNKRWKVRRGSNVDVKSLLRNVPGGVTLMNEPTTDVVGEEFNDITGSAYMEQDRLNVDFDELMGSFSASTIQTNRKMNETVGGMSMLQGTSHIMTEYLIRTFAETWAEPVIKQVVRLEQYYETDERLLAIVGDKIKLFQRYGIDRITDYLLMQDLAVVVNVGAGAADPTQRLNRLLTALKYVSEISQAPIPGLQMSEVIKEIFGIVGYRDGKRFINFEGEGPVIQQLQGVVQELQGQIQQLQAKLQERQAERETKLVQTEMKESAETDRLERQIDADLTETRMKIEGDIRSELINARASLYGRQGT